MIVKQVIVIRKDLKIRRGKEIAQGSHASSAFLVKRLTGEKTVLNLRKEELEWMDSGFTKVCLQVDSEKELMEIFQKAKESKLEVHLITDAGRTEFAGIPTKTCLAIGPDNSDKIDKVTGELKLY